MNTELGSMTLASALLGTPGHRAWEYGRLDRACARVLWRRPQRVIYGPDPLPEPGGPERAFGLIGLGVGTLVVLAHGDRSLALGWTQGDDVAAATWLMDADGADLRIVYQADAEAALAELLELVSGRAVA